MIANDRCEWILLILDSLDDSLSILEDQLEGAQAGEDPILTSTIEFNIDVVSDQIAVWEDWYANCIAQHPQEPPSAGTEQARAALQRAGARRTQRRSQRIRRLGHPATSPRTMVPLKSLLPPLG